MRYFDNKYAPVFVNYGSQETNNLPASLRFVNGQIKYASVYVSYESHRANNVSACLRLVSEANKI